MSNEKNLTGGTPAATSASAPTSTPPSAPAPAPTPPPAGAPKGSAPKGGKGKKKKKMTKKKRIVLLIVLAALIVAAALTIPKLIARFGGGTGSDVVTAFVQRGSITSTVSGEGTTRAKDSATLTLTTSGTVQEVYVKEGDHVTAGQQLYRIDSQAATDAVTAAQKDVDSCQKELSKLQQAQADLNVTAPFSGTLTNVQPPKVGDSVASGTTIATLVDTSKMKLTQYYSYAYAGQIKVGQSATISIPASMTTLTGTVSEVHMVNRISAEGSKLFEVDLVVTNPGTLTADMEASATLAVGGESAYPYESGKLAYNQTADIVTKVSGDAVKVNLRDYATVSAGQSLLLLSGDDNESQIFSTTTQLKNAQKALEEAQKALDLLNGVAPIDGTVLSISIAPGDEISTGTSVITVADTTTILVDANIDERNISYVNEGMYVDIDQWGTAYSGVITSVSLTGKTENGVATFPAVISIDNPDATLMSGSYVTYNLVASQSDDCLLVPIQAVKRVSTPDGDQTVVFVHTNAPPENAVELSVPVDGVPESGYYPVAVVTGISDTQNVEIKEGVEEGVEIFQSAAAPSNSGMMY